MRTVDVSDGVLQALNVPPAVGRWFSHEDQVPNGPERVMFSYGYWQRQFGGDRTVMGRNMMVDSRPREIVGVMPRGFRFVDADFDVLVPLALERGKLILAGFGFQGIARLKPGVTIAQANADMTRMLPIWMDTFTNGPGIESAYLRVVADHARGSAVEARSDRKRERTLWVVMGTIGW